MEKEKDQQPEALPDESLDEAAGGLLPAVHPGGVNRAGITDGTSKTGFSGGVRVATGDVNNDGSVNIMDGSVKPGA
jgi:hypothetical protein